NARLPFGAADSRIKAQSIFSDPALAADVRAPLGSASDAAKARLTNFDDVTSLVYYDPVNEHLGRSLAPHRELLDALEDSTAAELARSAAVLAAHPEIRIDQDTPFTSIPDRDTRQQLIALLEAAAKEEKQSMTRSAATVKALTRLVNNQPQLYVGATYHYRNPLVGPDERSVKATFELGAKSLNRFRREHGDACLAARTETDPARKGAAGKTCRNELIEFAGSGPATADDRLAFSLEYRKAESESVDLSGFGVSSPDTPVLRAGSHSLVYSLTYGRPVGTVAAKDARLDLAVNYD